MTYIPKTEEWFKARIGKRIYRDCQNPDHDETCPACKRNTEDGLVIRDAQHANYLAVIDADFAAEGVFSNYRE